MTIRKIYLQINEEGANYSARSDFDFEVFFITEYISRDLYKNKFKYEDVDKLVVYIESPKPDIVHDKLFKSLDYTSTMSYMEISRLDGHERIDKILELIEIAGSAYEFFMPGIRQVIHESIESFRNSGYKNIWLFKRKRVAAVGNLELICELNREMFTLTLVARNKSDEIFRKEILKTLPSSIIYHHKFKDILVDENNIVVTDRFDKPLYQVLISDILASS